MIKYIFTLLSVFILSNSYSQQINLKGNLINSKESNIYEIKGEIIGLQDTSVILAYYFGGKQYAADTAFSENGTFIFEGDETLDGGMYMIVLPNQQYFDLVISEQKFSFKTNINSLIESMEFTNSKENTPFYKYLKFISSKQKQVIPLRDQQKTASEKEKEEINTEIMTIDSEVKEFKDQFEEEYSDIFFTKVIKATTEPEIPEAPEELSKKDKEKLEVVFDKVIYIPYISPYEMEGEGDLKTIMLDKKLTL